MPVNQAKLQKFMQQGDKARIGGKVSRGLGFSDWFQWVSNDNSNKVSLIGGR